MGLKTYFCSDLHLEFHDDGGGKRFVSQCLPDADVIVVAGDLHVAEDVAPSLAMLAKRYAHVVYVAGNHDYYYSSLEGVEGFRASVTQPNVHWLEDQTVEIDGVRFVGCTLWFGWHEKYLEDVLSDFVCIADIRSWVHEKNRRSLEFLRRETTPESIVVTHHLPSNRSISPQFENDPTNCFYVCPEAEPILLDRRPQLWVHGHMHDSTDYQLGRTCVICNPYGYEGHQTNNRFKTDDLVLDL